jgi:hypothetical protein
MAMQLSNGDGIGAGRRNRSGDGRPMSYYGGQPPVRDQGAGRTRSKSVSNAQKYTQDGRPILHFGKFLSTVSGLSCRKLIFTLQLEHCTCTVPLSQRS